MNYKKPHNLAMATLDRCLSCYECGRCPTYYEGGRCLTYYECGSFPTYYEMAGIPYNQTIIIELMFLCVVIRVTTCLSG